MDTRTTVQNTLEAAKANIIGVARSALDAELFEESAWCARVAGEVDKLLTVVDSGDQRVPAAGEAKQSKNGKGEPAKLVRNANARAKTKQGLHSTPPAVEATARRAQKGRYPKFYKGAGNLVKVGWSKSQGAEYEHRAPRSAVTALVDAAHDVGKEKLFNMESLLPLRTSDGDEVPSYQAYLALAWLRAVGAVERHGQKGYKLDGNTSTASGTNELWDSLPSRRP